METLSPLGPVFHAGTLSGNPLATAAGLAALDRARRRRLHGAAGPRPPARRRCCATRAPRPGFPAQFPVVGTLVGHGASATCAAPTDFDGARRTDEAAVRRVLPRHARRGRRPRARRLRGAVRRPRPHRRTCSTRSASRAAPRRRVPRRADRRSPHPLRSARPDARRLPRGQGARPAGSVPAVRQVISWRFVAAIGALVGLALFVNVAFADRGHDRQGGRAVRPAGASVLDFVAIVLENRREAFALDAAGVTEGDLQMSLVPEGRTARVFAGTPGEITCPDLDKPCVLLAETLGDSITWFALLPLLPNFQFELRRSSRSTAATPTSSTGGSSRTPDHRPQQVRGEVPGGVVLRVPPPRRPRPPGDLQLRPERDHARRLLGGECADLCRQAAERLTVAGGPSAPTCRRAARTAASARGATRRSRDVSRRSAAAA